MANKDQNQGDKPDPDFSMEPQIYFYPHEHAIERLPYGIPFPQGCESPAYEYNSIGIWRI